MQERLKFYHNPQSRAVIAHWMLEEAGAEYEIVPIDFEAGDNRKAEFLRVNPMGKIPTIVLPDGTVLTETPAIIAFLADAYPQAGLAPDVGSSERGTYYRWLFFGSACFEPALTEAMMRKDAEPLPKMMVGWGSFDDVVDTLERELSLKSYLVGDRFTAADLYIGSELVWGTMFKAPRIEGNPVFAAYLARLRERPAYMRSIGS